MVEPSFVSHRKRTETFCIMEDFQVERAVEATKESVCNIGYGCQSFMITASINCNSKDDSSEITLHCTGEQSHPENTETVIPNPTSKSPTA